MPRTGENNSQNQENTQEKLYPWQIEENYDAEKKLDQYISLMDNPGSLVGKNKYVSDKVINLRDLTDENSMDKEKAEKVVGMATHNGFTYLLPYKASQKATDFIMPEQLDDAKKIYEDVKEVADSVSKKLRNDYKDGLDSNARRLHDHSEKYADFIDTATEVLNPAVGNRFKAEFDNPALGNLSNSWADIPRFEGIGFEKCTEILDRTGSNGKSIYDDYMTMCGSSLRGYKVEFHRQQMEKDGWDSEKEKTYLDELRVENKKTVEAFDNLWAIDDKGQYDEALGNPLDAMIGKNPIHNRNLNPGVGFMRGQVQAIDMGYDSRHLYILGELGVQEQMLKKFQAEIDFVKEQNNGILSEEYSERQKQLNEYKEDFQKLKENVWEKKVNGKEEMEAVGNQVSDFLESHNEKYSKFQKNLMDDFKVTLDYSKEMGEKFPQMPKITPRLNTNDIQTVMNIASLQTAVANGDDYLPGSMEKIENVMKNMSQDNGKEPEKDAAGNQLLSESMDKGLKDLAKDFSDGISKHKENNRMPDYPKTQELHDGMLDLAKEYSDSLQNGRHVSKTSDPDYTFALGRVDTLMPQLSSSLFTPENVEKTERALKDYPLDRYVRQGLDLHHLETDYKNRSSVMTQNEKDKFEEDIRAKKEEYLDTAKELYQKSLKPTEDTKGLFGQDRYLNDPVNGFISSRGLKGLIDRYESELSKTDIKDQQMDGFSAALDKVSAKRMGLFDSEGDERRMMREKAEMVQDNLKKLKSGMIESPDGLRPMTQDEKANLLANTIDDLNELSEKTNNYINHATKNGTKTPSGAGKTRLDGALELKDLTNDLQETLLKEQQANMRSVYRQGKRDEKKEAAKKTGKEGGRKSISFKEIEEKEKQSNPERKRRNSVREPSHRLRLEKEGQVKKAPQGMGKK